MEIIKLKTKERNKKMLITVEAVYIYIYIVRFNKKENINIEGIINKEKKAMCFRGT